MSLLFITVIPRYNRKSDHQCDFITRSFSVLAHMVKAVTAAVRKTSVKR